MAAVELQGSRLCIMSCAWRKQQQGSGSRSRGYGQGAGTRDGGSWGMATGSRLCSMPCPWQEQQQGRCSNEYGAVTAMTAVRAVAEVWAMAAVGLQRIRRQGLMPQLSAIPRCSPSPSLLSLFLAALTSDRAVARYHLTCTKLTRLLQGHTGARISDGGQAGRRERRRLSVDCCARGLQSCEVQAESWLLERKERNKERKE